MTRNILTSLIYLGCFIILIGCQSTTEKTGDFMILPAPQQFEISGISTLGGDDIQSYFSEEGTELPFIGALLKDIRKAESSTQAQVVIRLDADIDVKPEGYMLDITSKRITITGKDQADNAVEYIDGAGPQVKRIIHVAQLFEGIKNFTYLPGRNLCIFGIGAARKCQADIRVY